MKEEMEEQPPKKTLNEDMQAEEPRELPSRPPRPIPKLQQVQCGAHLLLCKYPLGLKERGLTASEEDEQEALALRAFWAGKENNRDLKTKIASQGSPRRRYRPKGKKNPNNGKGNLSPTSYYWIPEPKSQLPEPSSSLEQRSPSQASPLSLQTPPLFSPHRTITLYREVLRIYIYISIYIYTRLSLLFLHCSWSLTSSLSISEALQAVDASGSGAPAGVASLGHLRTPESDKEAKSLLLSWMHSA